MNFPERIILIGFRGTGKTTIGELLSKKLQWQFMDMDKEIQKEEKKTIKEIVEEKGWEYFRSIEKIYMKKVLTLKKFVISLGGGAVLHQEEMNKLKETSLVVWLKASSSEILKRLYSDKKTTTQRPNLTDLPFDQEIEKILKEREPLYRKFSHFSIDTENKTPEIIVKEITLRLKEVKR